MAGTGRPAPGPASPGRLAREAGAGAGEPAQIFTAVPLTLTMSMLPFLPTVS